MPISTIRFEYISILLYINDLPVFVVIMMLNGIGIVKVKFDYIMLK